MRGCCKKLLARPAALPLACYLLAAVCWVLLGAGGMLADRTLAAWQVPAASLELVDLAPLGQGSYAALSGDPQMIWTNDAGQRVRTFSYVLAEHTGDLREVCLYYNTAPGQPFDQRRRVYPRRVGDRYVFTLPRANIVALRLDPCSPGDGSTVELTFTADAIEFNAADVLPHGLDHFRPDWDQLFGLVLYPALAAAALDWLRALLCWLRKR